MYKRLIFTLLYDDGYFVLSRNFRLQRVGNLPWLQNNYKFGNIAESIDELVVLDVTRGEKNLGRFCDTIEGIASDCFVPMAAGGGISSLSDVSQLLRSGADKIVLNSALHTNPSIVRSIAEVIGAQSIVASVDFRLHAGGVTEVFTTSGTAPTGLELGEYVRKVGLLQVGEIYLTSVDKDGTGMGLALDAIAGLSDQIDQPIILSGGVGYSRHFVEGLSHPRLSAVASANLLNFIGDGLVRAREEVRSSGIPLARLGL